MTYDPTDHPLLSPEAKALDPETFKAYVERAEDVLGIAGTSYTGEDARRLMLAVVLQINFTLRREARGGGEVVAESKGSQSVSYAQPKDGRVDPVDPEAARIVAGVRAGGVRAPRVSTSTPNVFVW